MTRCDDSLEAIGFILFSEGDPIVVCAIDWTALMNEAHLVWRNAIAQCVGTSPDRVAVHCVHQHNAPFVCLTAREAAAQYPELPEMFDLSFFNRTLTRAREVIHLAMQHKEPVTHFSHGQSVVNNVASNRRVARDSTGRVGEMRGSSCVNPNLIALPEGVVDPHLQTISFYRDTEKVLSCHYYATHPMSYYRDGRVTSDFCGLARKLRQNEDTGCVHIYFTGCAGNVAAGKYNDGTPAARQELTQRLYNAIVASENTGSRQPIAKVEWRTQYVLPPPRVSPTIDAVKLALANTQSSTVDRLVAACRLGWLRRCERKIPLLLGCLRLNNISILHLPAEMFVEYQLRARAMHPDHPVAVAAYGDDGPWYIPTREEYSNDGYEVSVAFCSPEVDEIMTTAIRALLS